MRAKEKGTKVIQRLKQKQFGLVFSFARTKQKRPRCYKIWYERSEAKGVSPTLSKSKVKRIGVFQKFAKTNENEVKPFQILQNRSKTNVFVSDCEEEENRKKTKLRFFGAKRRKTNIIVPHLSKICHCYSRLLNFHLPLVVFQRSLPVSIRHPITKAGCLSLLQRTTFIYSIASKIWLL